MADDIASLDALGSPNQGSIQVALIVVQYLFPLSFLLCFISASTVVSCTKYGAKPFLTKHTHHVALWHVAAIDASFLAFGALYILRTLVDHSWWPSQPELIYVLGSVLSWSIFMVSLLETEHAAWKPYFGAIVLALCQEVSIVSLSLAYNLPKDTFGSLEVGLGALRVLILFSLCLHGTLWVREKHEILKEEEESEPLIKGRTTAPVIGSASYGTLPFSGESESGSNGGGGGGDYGASGEEEDDDSVAADDEEEKMRAEQLKKIKERGWWAYLKDFSMIFSIVWVWKYPKQRKWIFLLAFCLFVDRFLVVLVPMQLGIVTNKLIEDQGSGKLPWKEFLLWGLYRWLESSAGIEFVQDLAVECLSLACSRELSTQAYSHVLGLSMDFHQEKDTGEVLQAMEQGRAVEQIMFLIARIAPIAIDVTVAIWYIAYLFDLTIAWVVLCVFVFYILFSIKSTKWYLGARRNYTKRDREESKVKTEGIQNWTSVVYFNRRPYEESRYTGVVDSFVDALFNFHVRVSIVMGCQWLILEAGLLIVAFIAVYRVAHGEASIGSFVTLITYWGIIIEPIDSLTAMYRTILSALIDAERLLEIFKAEPAVKDHENSKELQLKAANVEFRNVVFSYGKGDNIIKDISFVAEAGKTVAIVGKTGSGKTTTLRLLSRFFDVTGGGIKIDGQDIRDVTLSSLRECMGIVPQDPSLFNTTIMENMRYARLDASDDEIKAACKAAAIHDKIESFADKYGSKVGERGVKLSGGELQRIAIARVILRNPAIVLLDEATSAVDSETEAQIQKAFRKLSAGRTTFVIAHRLSTIKEADLILVFQEGEIVERGTHKELLGKNGKYSELWARQISSLSEEGTDGLDGPLLDLDQ